MIPKVVYQTWYTREFHPLVEERLKKIRDLNCDYEFKLFTDEEMDSFVNTEFPGEIAECYNRLNIIVAKADFWRYLILYKYGGVYLDIDSSIEKPLRELVREDDEAILSAEQNHFKFVQWALFFTKEHPILARTIQFIVENIQKNSFPNDICSMTGPNVFTKAVLYTHYELFEEILDNRTFTNEMDQVYSKNGISYRVKGYDYSPFLCFKYDECFYLYIQKNHWHYEQAKMNLLTS